MPESSAPVIEVRGIRTRFGNAVIHEDVTLDIFRGEVFGIAGGSGCGKSTLLREMVLLERPAAGSIRIFGEEITSLTEDQALPLRRRVGVMFQRGALFSGLTVSENVGVPLREHTRLDDRLIDEIAAIKIAMAGLPASSADKLPSELSGGMRKRAALARALALDPEILFLDEPTAGLDPAGAAAFDELVEQLQQLLGLTIVIVTHDLDTLWRVTDRVAILGEGRVLALGSMEDLAKHDHPIIREYFHGARGRAAGEQAWKQK